MHRSRFPSWQPCSAAKPVSARSVLSAMAQPPSTQPPVMSFVCYADSLKAKLAAAEAAAAATEERCKALVDHNGQLQQQLWEKQQQLKQQQQQLEQLQRELAASVSVAETKKLAAEPAKPSFSPRFHPYWQRWQGFGFKVLTSSVSKSQAFTGRQVRSRARKRPTGHDRRSSRLFKI